MFTEVVQSIQHSAVSTQNSLKRLSEEILGDFQMNIPNVIGVTEFLSVRLLLSPRGME